METQLKATTSLDLTRFNRIYEEWKLLGANAQGQLVTGFNRIYEEWKLRARFSKKTEPIGFNRIYEEWKRQKTVKEAGSTLIVQSNLWGMETWLANISRHLAQAVQSNLWGMETRSARQPSARQSRSIESMRNGNQPSVSTKCCLRYRSIESMRNGNVLQVRRRCRVCQVQSNLWGMETELLIDQLVARILFNRIYEEWKLICIQSLFL